MDILTCLSDFGKKVPFQREGGPETPRVRAVTVGRGEEALPPAVESLSYRILQKWRAKKGLRKNKNI